RRTVPAPRAASKAMSRRCLTFLQTNESAFDNDAQRGLPIHGKIDRFTHLRMARARKQEDGSLTVTGKDELDHFPENLFVRHCCGKRAEFADKEPKPRLVQPVYPLDAGNDF